VIFHHLHAAKRQGLTMNFAAKLDTVFRLLTFPNGKFGSARPLSGACLAQITLA